MTPFAIAGVQMHVAAISDNVEAMAHRLEILMARFPWVQMVLLSELAVRGQVMHCAEPMPGPTEERLAAIAAEHEIWFVPGSLYERDGGRTFNTTPVIDPTVRVIGRHRKLFPFVPYEDGVTPGGEFFVFDVPDIGRFGVSICYDMWFPETSRTLASKGGECHSSSGSAGCTS